MVPRRLASGIYLATPTVPVGDAVYLHSNYGHTVSSMFSLETETWDLFKLMNHRIASLLRQPLSLPRWLWLDFAFAWSFNIAARCLACLLQVSFSAKTLTSEAQAAIVDLFVARTSTQTYPYGRWLGIRYVWSFLRSQRISSSVFRVCLGFSTPRQASKWFINNDLGQNESTGLSPYFMASWFEAWKKAIAVNDDAS